MFPSFTCSACVFLHLSWWSTIMMLWNTHLHVPKLTCSFIAFTLWSSHFCGTNIDRMYFTCSSLFLIMKFIKLVWIGCFLKMNFEHWYIFILVFVLLYNICFYNHSQLQISCLEIQFWNNYYVPLKQNNQKVCK